MVWDIFAIDNVLLILNEQAFYDFMVASAARCGQLINFSEISNIVGVSANTIREWISVLQASGIIHILYPFHSNINKRLSKTPKIYFYDCGLVCHLTGWNSPKTLRKGAFAGHIFENFVVSEILKSFINSGTQTRDIYFYRDGNQREVDIVIKRANILHPIEIKTNASVDTDAIKSFSCLTDFSDYEIGFGSVICQIDQPYLINESVQAVPVFAI